MSTIFKEIQNIQNSNKKAVLCTIITTKGSSPRKVGAKMLVYQNGKIYATIGGGALEKKVIEQALHVLQTQQGVVVSHNLVNELGMCCGGIVELFLEPIMNTKKLYVFGAGHIGKALVNFASVLNFDVTLIDERYEAFEGESFQSIELVKNNHKTAIEKLQFDENTFVVIVTHNHDYDREILALTAKQPHQYIGMIGSERKVIIAKKNVLAANILSQQQLDDIDMPIGIDINAITPEEIAVSILAKLIEVRNSK